MDELISIIEERKASITLMTTDLQRRHKSTFMEEQRKRNQRQNWILRVLKTLKILSTDQKKVILEITVKMMNYYQPTQAGVDDYEHINYIETYINLFVEFYNKFSDLDLTHIKTIIRPNNSYIMVDLIKSLIELGRKDFKNAVLINFRESYVSKSEHKLPEKIENKADFTIKIEPKPIQKQKPRISESKSDLQGKINCTLFEKYSRAMDHFNSQLVSEKFNELFLDLMYVNHKNAVKIQKYLDTCFGAKRHIDYNVSGLYTQKEIKIMVDEQKQKATNRSADLKELKGDISPEHLKQYFKIKVEIHEAQNRFFVKKPVFIRPWLPVAILKIGNKLHPFSQMFELNGNYYSRSEFQDKTGKKVKNYLKQMLSNYFYTKKLLPPQKLDLSGFNKREYLDISNAKLLQAMSRDSASHYSRRDRERDKQKEGFLPPIGNYQGEDLSTNRPSKSKSDSKLPVTSMMLPSFKISEKIENVLQRRMNHSSMGGEKKSSKKNIQSLIDTIIKSREYTLN